jgi:hypothetical protein
MRGVVLVGLAVKAVVLGVWCWGSVARAERSAPPAAATPAATGAAVVSDDLFAKSRGFRDLLEAVRERGLELEKREAAVAAREAALKGLEATLGERVGGGLAPVPPVPAPAASAPGAYAPAAAASASAATAGSTPPQAGACGVIVTKIYQAMKPEEAAPIFDRLDDATAMTIFGCMKEKQIGAILAVMSRDRAVALTRVLAGAP